MGPGCQWRGGPGCRIREATGRGPEQQVEVKGTPRPCPCDGGDGAS